jgi:hypothetical protein
MTTVRIPLTQGKFALVDEDDAARIGVDGWRACRNKTVWYAHRRLMSGTVQLLHRLVLEVPDVLEVDHINGDGLDNRRRNLRPATRRQNSCNRRKTTKRTTSRFKGVHLDASTGLWRAAVSLNGRKTDLGSHATELAAAVAYDRAAAKMHGAFAKLNLPKFAAMAA